MGLKFNFGMEIEIPEYKLAFVPDNKINEREY